MQCTNRYKKKNKDKNKINEMNCFRFSHSIKILFLVRKSYKRVQTEITEEKFPNTNINE